jgi:putative DNA primase/helicase
MVWYFRQTLWAQRAVCPLLTAFSFLGECMNDNEDPDPAEITRVTEWMQKLDSQVAALMRATMGRYFTKDPTIIPGATWADLDSLIGPIKWLWKNWLPQGMLTIIAGELGVGKSIMALRIAACFLRGDPWPDGTPYTGETGAVLWCEAEAAQAINLSRAKAWGLPLDRIYTPFEDPLVDILLDDPNHKEAIATVARREEVLFMVVDSLRGATRGDENSSETIAVTKWLAELARDTDKPLLLSHHLRKKGLRDVGNKVTLDRLRGSSAIGQPARVILAIDVPDPKDKEAKRLSVIKNNLARFAEPVGLSIDGEGVAFGDAPQEPYTETLQERAADLLLMLLASGPMPSADIRKEVEEAGLSWHAAKRAKEKLGIAVIKPDGVWHWSLPAKDTIPM